MYCQHNLFMKEDLEAKRVQSEKVECCRPEAQWQQIIIVEPKGTPV
jgi:hypothetical protein